MQFNDLGRQYERIKADVDKAVLSVMAEGCFILGPPVKALEERLAAFAGRRFCVSCSNGTDALTMSLRAMGVGNGDAVFTTAFSFFATAEAIVQAGAVPVFTDACVDTFNMDSKSLEGKIKKVLKEGKLTPKAVLPVDLFGLPADYHTLESIAKQYGLLMLEDGAQGFGGVYDGKRACSFGEVSTTSFFPAKPLGCYGDGGAIFTDDESIAEHLESLRHHGKGQEKYDNVRFGLNARLDTMQAAILHCKLDVFEDEVQKRQWAADLYTILLKDDIQKPYVPENSQSVWAQYTIKTKSASHREALMKKLKEQGIPSMVYYPKPLHLQTAFAPMSYTADMYPVASDLAQRVLSLPMHPYLTEAEIHHVAEQVNKAY